MPSLIFAHEQPSHTTVKTSGGVSANYNQDGVNNALNSPSAGDQMVVHVPKSTGEGNMVLERWVYAIADGNGDGYGDDLFIGAKGEGTAGKGVYLDLTNGQFNISGNTSATTVPTAANRFLLHITVDVGAGQTTIETIGPVNDSFTASATPSLEDSAVEYVYQGDSDKVWLISSTDFITEW